MGLLAGFSRQQLLFLETEETLLGFLPIPHSADAVSTSSKPVLDQTGGRGV